MTIHLVACGDSAKHWDGTGPSIGVNDCMKWGHPIDFLLLLNLPSQFQASRFDVIKDTRPKKVYTNTPNVWEKYFPGITYEVSPLFRWTSDKKLRKGMYHHSNTSPFVGLSLAYNWGFNNVVMWGVDLITHQKYGKEGNGHVQEMLKFDSYIKALQATGMKIYLGSKGTAFDSILPVWDKQLMNI